MVIGKATISRERETELNSYYHGFSAFGNSLMIQDDDDLLDKDQIREIKGIWKSDQAQGNGERD